MGPGGPLPGGFNSAQYQSPSFAPPQSPLQSMQGDRSASVQSKEEHQRILEKVTGVLPDINRLLEHYQVTRGELSAKDLQAKQTELQRTEEIARLHLQLDANKEEFDKLIERLVGENYKFKMEVQEKDSTNATLKEAAAEHESLKQEFAAYKTKHDEAVSTADAARLAKEELLLEKLKLQKELDMQRKKLKADVEGLKTEHKGRTRDERERAPQSCIRAQNHPVQSANGAGLSDHQALSAEERP